MSLPEFARVAAWIRQQDLSQPAWIETPFGRRLSCYADLTATGRHLPAVERWVQRLRPFYANTHTEISTTGRIMTGLRESARQAVRAAVNASDQDEVLFCGSGATAAVNKLVGLLGLRIPEPLDRAYDLSAKIPANERPLVFVGPYEHHSNELPWVESTAEVVEIALGPDGGIDLNELAKQLESRRGHPLTIGSFSACSNVTGVISDVPAIARTLHRAGALAFFDYAASAPYVSIDMHPEDPDERIDAVFVSPHKFVGGPESSGVLVAHRDLFRTRVPERPGGGTVDYVAGARHEDVDYVHALAEREEGGTPSIIGDIRAGMAFRIKAMAGPEAIREHEIALARRAAERLSAHPRIRVLGPTGVPRLAIVPIEIQGLHHELVSALLDHLFGIQNRAGCSCAGPYGHRLLGIEHGKSAHFRRLVRRGIGGIKPGWTRISLPWYASEADLDFMLSAVEFVAHHGMAFVPLYRFGWSDGAWRHTDRPDVGHRPVAFSAAALMEGRESPDTESAITEDLLQAERRGSMDAAVSLAAQLEQRWQTESLAWNTPTGNEALDDLVWFRYVHATPLAGDPENPPSL